MSRTWHDVLAALEDEVLRITSAPADAIGEIEPRDLSLETSGLGPLPASLRERAELIHRELERLVVGVEAQMVDIATRRAMESVVHRGGETMSPQPVFIDQRF